MTFWRAVATALMSAGFVMAALPGEDTTDATVLFLLGGAWLWAMTRDPLPAAIRNALDEYTRDYRR